MFIPQIPAATGRGTPEINAADLSLIYAPEAGAYGHWLFGPDADGKETLVGPGTLTNQSTAPTYSTAHASIASRRSLLTNISDSATRSLSMCAVFRIPAAGMSGINPLLGNLISGVTAGRSIYTSTGSLIFRVGGASNSPLGLTLSADKWYFLAFSHDPTVSTDSLRVVVGGSDGISQNYNSAGIVPGPNNFAIGDPAYNSAGSKTVDYAEAIVFDETLTIAQMKAIYRRSAMRMSARGITIGTV